MNLFLKCCVLSLVLVAISCSKDVVTSNPTTGSISGTVIDTNGNPVAKAIVSSAPSSSQLLTDAAGAYSLTDLTPGFYTVTAQKSNVGTGSAAVNVIAGKTTTAVIMLEPGPVTTGILVGTVVDSGGIGISGAQISTTPATSAVMSDASGHFVISAMPAASYSVHASKSGYVDASTSVTIVAGQTSTITLSMNVPGAITLSGLLAYYPLDGDTKDASGNHRDLTLTGGTFIPSRSSRAQALRCDGATTVATGTTDAGLNPASITVSLWMKASNPDPSTVITLLSKYVGNSMNGWTLWFTNGNVEWLYGAGGSFTFSVIDRSAIMDNGWHSVICTAGPNGTAMYFDGVLAASGSWSGAAAATTQTHPLVLGVGIAADQTLGGFYFGAVDDIRIYGRVLTSDEIHALASEP